MKHLWLSVVPALPIEQAERRFADFRIEQPEIVNALSVASVEVVQIRGAGLDNSIIPKRSYRISIPEPEASLFRPTDDPTRIEVLVVAPNAPEIADAEFAEWWSRHAALRNELGERGYQLDVIRVRGFEERQYRLWVTAKQARLLAEGDP